MEGMSCKASASNLHRITADLPAIVPALSAEFSVFDPLPTLASLIRSSDGKVSSSRTTCLVDSDVTTMAGRSEVAAMLAGNLSCLPRSTWSRQARAVVRSPPAKFGWMFAFCPALTEVIDCFEATWDLLFYIAMQVQPRLSILGRGVSDSVPFLKPLSSSSECAPWFPSSGTTCTPEYLQGPLSKGWSDLEGRCRLRV